MAHWNQIARSRARVVSVSALCIFGIVACGSVGFSSEQSVTPEKTAAATSTRPEQTTIAPIPPTTIRQLVDPAGIASVLTSGEPFVLSLVGEELPKLPDDIPGFVLYDGPDREGVSGAVRTSETRVFHGDVDPRLILGFSTQMNGCNDAIWILRWVSKNPDVLVQSTNEVSGMAVDPYFQEEGDSSFADSVPESSWTPEGGIAGVMSNSICFQPGFRISQVINNSGSTLVDVIVEWSYFDRDYFANQ